MKKTLLRIGMILALASCADEIVAPQDDSAAQHESELQGKGKVAPNGRTPDGSGSGDDSGGSGANGYALTYHSTYGKWSGSFGGTIVWFWGPTPTQLSQGIMGEWPVACPPGSGSRSYNESECGYADGFTVYGNGSGFTVIQPMCSSTSTVTITMDKLTITTNAQGSREITWTPVTRTVTTLSGSDCSLVYNGKVIVNSACKPVIVDIDSTYPANLCMLQS